jgi:DNA-binding protein Fis
VDISENRQAVITPGDLLQPANVIFSASQIFDLSPDGIVVLDENGQILHANKSFLGLAEEEALAPIVGTSLDRWLGSPGGNLKLLVDSLRLCGSVRHFPVTIKGTLGGNTATEVSAVLKSSPAPVFIALYIHDVNSRPEIPDQSEMLLEFLSGVAGPPGQASLKKVVSSTVGLVERFYIEAALQAVDGNRTAAARILGISRQGFHDKLAR